LQGLEKMQSPGASESCAIMHPLTCDWLSMGGTLPCIRFLGLPIIQSVAVPFGDVWVHKGGQFQTVKVR
jgi:hypothetical protein